MLEYTFLYWCHCSQNIYIPRKMLLIWVYWVYIACKQRAHLPHCNSSMMKNAFCYFGLIAFSFSSDFVLLICFISFNLFHTKHLEINHRNQNHKVRSWTDVIRYELRLRQNFLTAIFPPLHIITQSMLLTNRRRKKMHSDSKDVPPSLRR